jgi:hypothetical protein
MGLPRSEIRSNEMSETQKMLGRELLGSFVSNPLWLACLCTFDRATPLLETQTANTMNGWKDAGRGPGEPEVLATGR